LRERLILVLAALAAFGSTLWAGFLFDDFGLFADPAITSPSGWWQVWKPLQTRPLTWFSFWVNYQTSGQSPWGWHLVNLLLHIAVVLLLWELLKDLLPAQAALAGAAIFSVHPILTEPVAYVFARASIIATLASVVAIHQWIKGKSWGSVGWFLVAMLGKEECAAVPIFLLLLDFSRRRPVERKPLGAMFVVALALGLRTVWAATVTPGSQAGVQAGISPWSYFAAEGGAVLRYLRMTILPSGLTIDPSIARPSPAIAALAWVVVAALVLVASQRFERLREGFWFLGGLILLAPSSTILPAADLAADRRMYLPMIAFSALLGLVLERTNWKARAAVVLVFAAVAFHYSTLWRNPEELWTEAVRQSPQKIRPRIQLARSVEPVRALSVLGDAERVMPDNAGVLAEKGRVLLELGRAGDALAAFGQALAMNPADARAMNNRGAALLALGQAEAARADFERALDRDACLFDARVNLLRIGIRKEIPEKCSFTRQQLTALGR
jgi:protein O-mannosyl-transferase